MTEYDIIKIYPDQDNLLVSKKFKDIIFYDKNKKPQHQCFAINFAKGKSEIQKGDHIIVTVGVNYGQNISGVDCDENSKTIRGIAVDIDDTIEIMRENLSKITGLKNDSFHLIMTNLSPWITNETWNKITEKENFHSFKTVFLRQAEILGYIGVLKEELDGFDVIWVGHTKSIWKELKEFMQYNLALENFHLTFNLAYSWYKYPWYNWHKKITADDNLIL